MEGVPRPKRGVRADCLPIGHEVRGEKPVVGVRVKMVLSAGSYLRRIESCSTQLKAQRRPRICNGSEEEEVSVIFLSAISAWT